MKGFNFVVTTLGMLATISSANSASYIWDNQEGLKEVSDCKISEMNSNPFKISKYTGRGNKTIETLRNSRKVKQTNLPIGSLIRMQDGGKRINNYKYVYVVGVNYSAVPKTNRYHSKRNEKNYLFHKSVLKIDDYAIELTRDVSPSGSKSLKRTVLVPVTSPSYQRIECDNETSMKNREYVLFNAYTEGKAPIAIGVSIEETGIFKNIKTKLQTSYSDIETTLLAELSSNQGKGSTEVPTVEEEQELLEDVVKEEVVKEEEVKEEVVKEEEAKPEVGIENVICHSFTALNVRDESLKKIIFGAKNDESVKVFQSWSGEALEKVVGNSTVKYIKVQFADREESDQKIGWVSAKYVIEANKCPKVEKIVSTRDKPASKITGLKDKKCCDFPTMKVPTHPYTGKGANQRRFRAGRSGGRLHAACDLYRYKGEGVRSIAPGKVIDRDHFYQGTSQISVKHDGGFVVRYGEIISNRKANMRVGKKSKMGEIIGYIGKVNSGCCRPMLHFELYDGSLTGSLSKKYRNKRGKFSRRNDLLNPTPYLVKWQDKIF